ncbi:MAG: signal recognition particle protein [Thermoflexales bacterium]|nr:signal recognition particle protein [Thermoflexales bacterium]
MFDNLTGKLQEVFKKLSKRGKLTEADVDEALREVRLALLEADVNFKVVKEFLARVRVRAIGAEVSEALNPAQQVIKIVHDELLATLGTAAPLDLSGSSPHVIMLVGLQGSGKTTTAAKLAVRLRGMGNRPLLVAADTYRPAAVAQLETLGKQLNIPVHSEGTKVSPVDICKNALKFAREQNYSVVVLDTAGRLAIDDQMMAELEAIKKLAQPREILLVSDAMTGQDAVRTAEEFYKRVGVTGLILTKVDGDARGGAAISIRAVTGVPIKFLGIGEKTDALEIFHPDRLASRILGMGDMLTLIEKAQEHFDQEQSAKAAQKMLEARFDLEDFLQQMKQMKKMGPLSGLLDMIPGLGNMKGKIDANEAEQQMKQIEAIINSMTMDERRRPDILNGSRKRRVAKGSGTSVQEVNQLIHQFRDMQRMMKQLGKGGRGGGLGALMGRR